MKKFTAINLVHVMAESLQDPLGYGGKICFSIQIWEEKRKGKQARILANVHTPIVEALCSNAPHSTSKAFTSSSSSFIFRPYSCASLLTLFSCVSIFMKEPNDCFLEMNKSYHKPSEPRSILFLPQNREKEDGKMKSESSRSEFMMIQISAFWFNFLKRRRD